MPVLSYLGALICVGALTPFVTAVAQIAPVERDEVRSTGFTDSANHSSLVDYRVPDWGYHRWSVDFAVVGEGEQGGLLDKTQANSSLASAFHRFRESESRRWDLSANVGGVWQYAEQDRRDDADDWIDRHVSALASLSMDRRDYRMGNLAVLSGLVVQAGYQGRGRRTITSRSEERQRNLILDVKPGLGYGRRRDVLPSLRALRFSERLQSLGRTPLTETQVQELASIFARSGGYSLVYERKEKHFWDDLFRRFDGGQSFSAYEVMFLAEVLSEDLGDRREGLTVDLITRLGREIRQYDDWQSVQSHFAPTLDVKWTCNLGLEQQVGIGFLAEYSDSNGDVREDDEVTSVVVSADHLVVVADRAQWSQMVEASFQRTWHPELSWRESRELLWSCGFSYFIEDRVRFGPDLSVHWFGSKSNRLELDMELWDWRIGFQIGYVLDRGLF